jgi:hypothetical protein
LPLANRVGCADQRFEDALISDVNKSHMSGDRKGVMENLKLAGSGSRP